MSYSGTRTITEATLTVMSEADLAGLRRVEGGHVVQSWGRWWEEMRPGFYHSIHWAARHHRHEARRPTLLCWGFRTTLADDAVSFANGALPMHMLSDLEHYEIDVLSKRRRYLVRKCLKCARIVQVMEPGLLREQGYEVRLATSQRLGIWAPPSKQQYLAELDQYVESSRFIIAGLSGEGKLGGYMDAFVVDGTAYVDRVYLAPEGMAMELGSGLLFEFIQVCRRSGKVREIVHGLHIPSNKGLNFFKEAMGFAIVRMPSRFWILEPIGRFIRWRQPESYYRLTGRGSFAGNADAGAHSIT
jgi:hypothetical protein